jgi:uncharacterized protein (TIGR02147 family)
MTTKSSLKKIAKNHERVTSFVSYQEYLESLYNAAKSSIKPYSWIEFANDLGFSRTNVLRLFVTRERVLSSKAASKIVLALGLVGSEKRYFENLVKFQNSKNTQDRDKFFLKMLAEKGKKSYDRLDERESKYLSEWYFPVLREIYGEGHASLSPEEIRDSLNFPLRLDTIKQAIEHLLAMEYLVKDSSGKITVNQSNFETPKHVDSLAVTRFHQQMIDLGKESITRVKEDERSIQALTVKLNPQSFAKLEHRLTELIGETLSLEDSEGGDIYQLNIQLFPFLKRSEKP